MTHQPPTTTPTPPFRRPGRSALATAVIAAVPLLLVAAGLAVWSWLTADITVTGTVTVVQTDNPGQYATNEECTGRDGYDDLREGAPVVITNASGDTVGLGRLGAGEFNVDSACVFKFEVNGVPSGEDFYGVEVSRRGRVQYEGEQVRDGVELTIGK